MINDELATKYEDESDPIAKSIQYSRKDLVNPADLATHLESLATGLRNGTIESMAFSTVYKQENGIVLEHGYANTNPYKENPESGMVHLVSVERTNETGLTPLYENLMNQLSIIANQPIPLNGDQTAPLNNAWWYLGFGQEGEYCSPAILVGIEDEE